jgi:hypothetical protein
MDKALNLNRIYYSFIRISNKKFNIIRVSSYPLFHRSGVMACGKMALVQKFPSQYTALVVLFTELYILEGRKKDENCMPMGKPQVQRK